MWPVCMSSPFAPENLRAVALQQGWISKRSFFDEVFFGSRYFATLMQTASARYSHQRSLYYYRSKVLTGTSSVKESSNCFYTGVSI